MDAYLGLLENNIELMARSLKGSAEMMEGFARKETDGFADALQQVLFDGNPAKLAQFTARQAELLDLVVNVYPGAIDAIAPEYGFHFERGEHVLADETDRFYLYRVAPSLSKTETHMNAKPVSYHTAIRAGSEYPGVFARRTAQLRPLFRQPGLSYVYSYPQGHRHVARPSDHERR